MELNVLTKPSDLKAIEAGWSNLLQHPCNSAIYQHYDWFMAGYKTFHQKDRPYVLTVTDNRGKLSGVAPLVITSGPYRGIKVKRIGFAKNSQSPANDFILSTGAEEECLIAVLDHLTRFKEWELVDLRKLNAKGSTVYFLQKLLSERGHAFGTRENIESPYLSVNMKWDDFWKSRSSRFRKSIRNKLNRALKQENLSVKKIPVTGATTPELQDILKISSNSWKHEIGNDLLTREDNWSFYKRICEVLGPKGLINIWIMKLDNIPVAFEFHIQYNNVVYPIRADYDKNYKSISPGSILEYEIVKDLFNDCKVSEYNSCGHTYHYLMNWTDTTRKHQDLEIFGNSLKMSMLYGFEYKALVVFRKYLFSWLKRK